MVFSEGDSAQPAAMHPWFIYNALHLAVTALSRRNLDACERFLRDAQGDLGRID
jgi:hypothetical protein